MRIAILLHGLLRSWNECSTVFSYYKTLYPDVHFDFYLSTWTDSEYIPIDKGERERFQDNTKLNLKDFSLHEEKDAVTQAMILYRKIYEHPNGSIPHYTPWYAYLKQKVCELVKEDYDVCILCRCDIFIFKELLDLIISKKMELGSDIVYNYAGTVSHLGHLFAPRDLLWYGSQKAILKHKEFYSDCYQEGHITTTGIHRYNAKWLSFKRLYNSPLDSLSEKDSTIVRSNNHLWKTGTPTKFHIRKLIKEHGKDLYKIPTPKLIYEHMGNFIPQKDQLSL